MKIRPIFSAFCAILSSALYMGCNDDVSTIGSSLSTGEVSIMVDSLTTSVDAECIYYDNFDARNSVKLLGRINVPEYGRLSCSFVSQMMSATRMAIPDSIDVSDVDSLRLMLSVPRGSLTGDSLAPQQLTVYKLDDQLPADINANFSPDGYYNPSSPLGKASYTLSNIAKGDSALKNDLYIRIPVKMPIALGREIFTKYREDDAVFQWPETFIKYFPGIYVEQNFGNGCIANVSKAEMYTYWHYLKYENEMQPDSTYKLVPRLRRDSVCLMASQPEVVSSNVIEYQVSDHLRQMVTDGKTVLSTPGGYLVKIKFPVLSLLDEFHRNGAALSVVSSLRFEIPALAINNDFNLKAAPDILMIKNTEYEAFFRENKVPDNKTSFYASYDADAGAYKFNSMRAWFVNLLEDEQSGKTISEEDYEFVLVPVNVVTEQTSNYDGSVSTFVTRCQPYLNAPTMTELFLSRALICFTYSSQQLR